jgi:hypothetical protein
LNKKLIAALILLVLVIPTASSYIIPAENPRGQKTSDDDSGIRIVDPYYPGYYILGDIADHTWQVDPTCDNYRWIDITALRLVLVAIDNTTGDGMEMVEMYADGVWKDRQYKYNTDDPINNSFVFYPRRGKQHITFVAYDKTGGTTEKTIYLEQTIVFNHWNPHLFFFLKQRDCLLSYAEYDNGTNWRGGPRFSYNISCPFNYYHILWSIRADIFCNNGTEHYQEMWCGCESLYPFSLKEKPHIKLSASFSKEWLYDNIDYGDWAVHVFIDGRFIYEDHVRYEHQTQ